MEPAVEPQRAPNGVLNGSGAPPRPTIETALNPDPSPAALPSPDHDARSDPDADEDDQPDGTSFASATLSPSVTSPPYWLNTHPHHQRTISNLSAESILPGGITMRDNEADETDGRNNACWAKSVQVTNYVVVNSSATNIGAFVVWNIKVETLSGSFMNIRKRYSEFDDFRRNLVRIFPHFGAAVPVLPPKSIMAKFQPKFLEKRRAGLQYFLNCIMLNPEFSGSPVLQDFLFA